VDAYPDRRINGTVSQIRNAPITVQNVVTYIVVIKVDNHDLHLKPGMTANVSIETGRRDGVLKVPAAALRFKPRSDKEAKKGGNAPAEKGKGPGAGKKGGNGSPKQQVYLLKDGKPQAVPVQTGLSDARFVEITEGAVQEGDEVIVEQVDDTKKKSSGGMPMGPRM
jgi:HlyD family secretion protein